MGIGITEKTLLDAASSTGAGDSSQPNGNSSSQTFQAVLGTAGTLTASVDVEGSNNDSQWVWIGTISLSGASDTDGFATSARWARVRGNVKALGSGADVTLIMGG